MGELKRICLFCLKTYPGDCYSDPECVSISLQQFFQNIERLAETKIGRNSNEESRSNLIQCCAQCLEIVDTVSDLFHEIKVLELNLEWKIKTLVKLMKAGGKVSSRQKDLRGICDEMDSTTTSDAPKNSFKNTIKFRRQLIKQCCKYKSPLPRIVLSKITENSHAESSRETRSNVQDTVALILVTLLANYHSDAGPRPKENQVASLSAHDILLVLEDSEFDPHSDQSPTNKPFETEAESCVVIKDAFTICQENADLESAESYDNDDDDFVEIPFIADNCLPTDAAILTLTLTETENGMSFEESKFLNLEENQVATKYETTQQENQNIENDSGGAIAQLNDGLQRVSKLRTIYRCEICSRTFSSTLNFEEHRKLHEQNVNAETHNDTSSSAYDAESEDMQQSDGEKFTLTCEKCPGRQYKSKDSLDDHRRNFHNDCQQYFPFKCSVENCGKRAANEVRLQSHMRKYHHQTRTKKWHICNDCPDALKFKTSNKLYRHRLKFHSKDSRCFPYQCDVGNCKMKTSCLRGLQKHKGIYHTGKEKKFAHRKRKNSNMKHASNVKMKARQYRCQLCFKTCKGLETLLNHNKIHNRINYRENPKKILRFLNRTIESNQNLKRNLHRRKKKHLQSVAPARKGENLYCKHEGCDQKFYFQEELHNHSKFHGNFPCTQCEFVTEYAPDLPMHEAENHCISLDPTAKVKSGAKCLGNFRCLHCEYKIRAQSRWKWSYIMHVLESHMSLSWKTCICEICKKPYFADRGGVRSRKRIQQQHFNFYHDVSKMKPEEILRCDYPECSAYFRTKVQLMGHRKHAHELRVNCKHCGKDFSGRNRRHERRLHLLKVHNANFTVVCKVQGCTSKFPDEDDLFWHMQRCHRQWKHHGKINCRRCDQQFGVYAEFLKHINFHHRKKKPRKTYICEICGKVSPHIGSHRVHALCHSGPSGWEYCCDICGRKCSSKIKFAQHKQTHTGEKPFQCQICGNKYAHRHNLRIHINSKHGDVTEDKAKKRTNI